MISAAGWDAADVEQVLGGKGKAVERTAWDAID
jgi:hypothetical protein